MNIIKKLQQMQSSGAFPQYIEYIRLPKFKDVEENTRINFEFPVTVFIGGNGTRKSSVLKAIQGCPEGESPAKYWFSTQLDPITDDEDDEDDKKLRPSIVHAYKDNQGNVVESLKIRVNKKGRTLDYWETSRPRKIYGMSGKARHNPVKKKVIYLNFRSLLPAFDKCFYYSGRENVQNYIRHKTPSLNAVIKGGGVTKVRGKPQNQPRIMLSANELASISSILGRQYKKGVYIRHRFFDGEGDTVLLSTEYHQYSEAFAGSGEVAVAVLVRSIESAPTGSLIVLDEPEVSLHPEAQQKLRDYILEKAKAGKHQIVLSTHSPFIAEQLPKEAIKVFRVSPETGKTEVLSGILPQEAFSVIGYVAALDKKIIWVEDRLAKNIFDQFLSHEDTSRQNLFEVRITGNDTQSYKDMSHACGNQETKNYFYVIDGDNKPDLSDISIRINSRGLGVISSISAGDMDRIEFLEELIKKQSHQQSPTTLGLNRGGDSQGLLQDYKKYLNFMETNAAFLPKSTPEEVIWSKDYALKQIKDTGLPAEDIEGHMARIDAESDFKEKFRMLTEILLRSTSSDDIFHVQKMFVNAFFIRNEEDAISIKSLISYIVTKPN